MMYTVERSSGSPTYDRRLRGHREQLLPEPTTSPPPYPSRRDSAAYTPRYAAIRRRSAAPADRTRCGCGIFFYAYIVLDLWNRSRVGWRVETEENVEISKQLFRELKALHGFQGLFLHSDNGNPLKGGTILALFYELGITPSFSRPRVSDDKPYIESFTSTMKRRVDYPNAFEQIGNSRTWMTDFGHYYNTEHIHSAIGYVTPHQRRHGEDHAIFTARNEALKDAFELRPERWVRGPKHFVHESEVILNPAEQNGATKMSKNLRQLC